MNALQPEHFLYPEPRHHFSFNEEYAKQYSSKQEFQVVKKHFCVHNLSIAGTNTFALKNPPAIKLHVATSADHCRFESPMIE